MEKIGLNIEELKEYLNSGKASKKVEKHLEEAVRYKIGGVPTFIIGDRMIVGAQPYEKFKGALEETITKNNTNNSG